MVYCYVGLGGNFKNTLFAMRQAISELKGLPCIEKVTLSKLYRTTPVSGVPQADYLNAVCRFKTTLSVTQLCSLLQEIEHKLGKVAKAKDRPRLIDLDLLFYGQLTGVWNEWVIPHPRWQERLFVLRPLADVTDRVPIGGDIPMENLLKDFPNLYGEKIVECEERIEDALC